MCTPQCLRWMHPPTKSTRDVPFPECFLCVFHDRVMEFVVLGPVVGGVDLMLDLGNQDTAQDLSSPISLSKIPQENGKKTLKK